MLTLAPDRKSARGPGQPSKSSLTPEKATARPRWEDEPVADLIDIATARQIVLREAGARPLGSEPVPVDAALGRILAEDVASEGHLPPFDTSAMDGYAVVAGPAAELPVVGESRAGAPAATALAPGQAIRISTGAQVPEGANSVVPVERTTRATAW